MLTIKYVEPYRDFLYEYTKDKEELKIFLSTVIIKLWHKIGIQMPKELVEALQITNGKCEGFDIIKYYTNQYSPTGLASGEQIEPLFNVLSIEVVDKEIVFLTRDWHGFLYPIPIGQCRMRMNPEKHIVQDMMIAARCSEEYPIPEQEIQRIKKGKKLWRTAPK